MQLSRKRILVIITINRTRVPIHFEILSWSLCLSWKLFFLIHILSHVKKKAVT